MLPSHAIKHFPLVITSLSHSGTLLLERTGIMGDTRFIFAYLFEKSVTLYNTGALISINSCLTNAQIIMN